MRSYGFENVVHERLTLGIVAIHVARKPSQADIQETVPELL